VGTSAFGLDDEVDENDVTDDMLGDNEDEFDFASITRGVPGASELLSGGRRLQSKADATTMLFGSANLAL